MSQICSLLADDAGNTISAAKPISPTSGSATIDGVAGPGDVDYYSFPAAAGQSVRVTLDLATRSPTAEAWEPNNGVRTNLDSEVTIWSAAGASLFTLTNDNGILSGTLDPKALPGAVSAAPTPANGRGRAARHPARAAPLAPRLAQRSLARALLIPPPLLLLLLLPTPGHLLPEHQGRRPGRRQPLFLVRLHGRLPPHPRPGGLQLGPRVQGVLRRHRRRHGRARAAPPRREGRTGHDERALPRHGPARRVRLVWHRQRPRLLGRQRSGSRRRGGRRVPGGLRRQGVRCVRRRGGAAVGVCGPFRWVSRARRQAALLAASGVPPGVRTRAASPALRRRAEPSASAWKRAARRSLTTPQNPQNGSKPAPADLSAEYRSCMADSIGPKTKIGDTNGMLITQQMTNDKCRAPRAARRGSGGRGWALGVFGGGGGPSPAPIRTTGRRRRRGGAPGRGAACTPRSPAPPRPTSVLTRPCARAAVLWHRLHLWRQGGSRVQLQPAVPVSPSICLALTRPALAKTRRLACRLCLGPPPAAPLWPARVPSSAAPLTSLTQPNHSTAGPRSANKNQTCGGNWSVSLFQRRVGERFENCVNMGRIPEARRQPVRLRPVRLRPQPSSGRAARLPAGPRAG